MTPRQIAYWVMIYALIGTGLLMLTYGIALTVMR